MGIIFGMKEQLFNNWFTFGSRLKTGDFSLIAESIKFIWFFSKLYIVFLALMANHLLPGTSRGILFKDMYSSWA